MPALAHAECKVIDYGTMPVQMEGFRAVTEVDINGRKERFMLDTGGFYNFMSRATSDELGLARKPMPLNFTVSGIGGSFVPERVTVKSMGILGAKLPDVDFLVGGSDTGRGILGANLLDVADADIDLSQGRVRLIKPEGCGKADLGRWALNTDAYNAADLISARSAFDRRSLLIVQVNGKPVHAVLDTGAETTIITRKAALRAGVDLTGPAVKPAGRSSGIGRHSYPAVVAPVAMFQVGSETIRNSQMMVIDGDMGENDETEMLLGADFFLAHHIYIANSQRKVYFLYRGGRIFALAGADTGDKQHAKASNDAPITAADYALRGQAYLSRGETAKALADLDEAVRQAPENATYYAARARAHLASRQVAEGLADVDKALTLDPSNLEMHLLRARLRLRRHDRAGAEADIAAARQLAPRGTQQSLAVAHFFIAEEKPAEALPMLDDWIKAHPDDSDLGVVYNSRCWARALANQQLDAAQDDCRRALRRVSNQSAILDSLGLVQLRMGHYAEAIASYDQVLAQQPKLAWSLYGRGLAKLALGQTGGGKADLAAAVAVSPGIAALAGRYGLPAPAGALPEVKPASGKAENEPTGDGVPPVG